MGRPFPALAVGSEIVGLACVGCREPFAPGDVTREIITRKDGEPLEVEAAFAHADCTHPRG